jgi:hypothetical protein
MDEELKDNDSIFCTSYLSRISNTITKKPKKQRKAPNNTPIDRVESHVFCFNIHDWNREKVILLRYSGQHW